MQQFPVFLKLLRKCVEYFQTVNPTSAVIVQYSFVAFHNQVLVY